MKYRNLGSLRVAPLGLGCMGMSTAYHRADRAEAIATIRHALDVGINLLDTAEMYGRGDNESLVGEALKGRRDEAVVATKFGIRTVPVVGLPRGLDGRPEMVRRSLDGSLRRLGLDHIDLYYLHRVDPLVPVQETVGAMTEAVTAGKVRELGISEATAADLRAAHAVHPLAALQSEWSVFSRQLEDHEVPAARELEIGIVPYSPLGRGMLTGTAEATTKLGLLDYRRLLPRWRKSNLEHNLAQVAVVRELAAGLGATPAQLALAWLLARGEDVVPIPGTSKRHRLDDNVAAAELTVPDEVLEQLNALSAAGDRYPGGRAERGVPTSRRRR